MQETPVQFLGQEDALEQGMATHSSILDTWRADCIQHILHIQPMSVPFQHGTHSPRHWKQGGQYFLPQASVQRLPGSPFLPLASSNVQASPIVLSSSLTKSPSHTTERDILVG